MTKRQEQVLREESARLAAALEARRAELMAIAGVTGTAVGLAKTDPRSVVIQILVSQPSVAEEVHRKAASILGRQQPLETIVMPIPEAREASASEGGSDHDASRTSDESAVYAGAVRRAASAVPTRDRRGNRLPESERPHDQ
jgi:hypothetical protein